MDFIYNRILDKCLECPYKNKNKVYGRSKDKFYSLALMGEAPGKDEDEQGIPFVGKAGKLLNKMLKHLNINRDNVYIFNYLLCRPDNNDFNSVDSMIARHCCFDGFYEEVKFLKNHGTDKILTLGSNATGSFEIFGRMKDIKGKEFSTFTGVKIIPTYHPSYLIRNGIKESCDNTLWKEWEEDFKKCL
jgi:DNA polymerase